MPIDLDEFGRIGLSHNLRLDTLIKIRWLAIVGQTVAVAGAASLLDFEPTFCFELIVASAVLNLVLTFLYPPSLRISSGLSALLLAYDIVQLTLLLFLTGGLQNPFSILLLVPVIISATALSKRYTFALGVLGILCASLLSYYHFPLPWFPGSNLDIPNIYVAGLWAAIVLTLSFTAIYAFKVADEARQLAGALSATELVLMREQHLSSLDGLAAAAAHELGTPLATIALVSKEMSKEISENSPLYEDTELLRSQAQRCREILQTLTSLSTTTNQHISVLRFSLIMNEVAEPHRNFGTEVEVVSIDKPNEPRCTRNPAILSGLGNIVENAVDYASTKVRITTQWDEENLTVFINDDGNGFGDDMLTRIGEPFVKDRSRVSRSGGLGLGLFIAKSLLERTGAKLEFSNASFEGSRGAFVKVTWPRQLLEVKKPQQSEQDFDN